jgi:hypothetical protein
LAHGLLGKGGLEDVNMRTMIVSILMAAVLAIGCGSSPHTVGSQATCEANCDREAALACPRAPANLGDSCKMLCASARSSFPQCTAQIDAVSACVADKVTFTCVDGIPTVSPVGACANEGRACLTCTGELLGCAG